MAAAADDGAGMFFKPSGGPVIEPKKLAAAACILFIHVNHQVSLISLYYTQARPAPSLPKATLPSAPLTPSSKAWLPDSVKFCFEIFTDFNFIASTKLPQMRVGFQYTFQSKASLQGSF